MPPRHSRKFYPPQAWMDPSVLDGVTFGGEEDDARRNGKEAQTEASTFIIHTLPLPSRPLSKHEAKVCMIAII